MEKTMTTDTSLNTDKHNRLSMNDFLNFGVDQMAYVKGVRRDDGHQVFGIYAADGTQLSVLERFESAIAVLHDNDLTPVSVH